MARTASPRPVHCRRETATESGGEGTRVETGEARLRARRKSAVAVVGRAAARGRMLCAASGARLQAGDLPLRGGTYDGRGSIGFET